jgi:ubiquinone/menaquinone biosynthesis C-methylase UbiE
MTTPNHSDSDDLIRRIQDYWNKRIHDVELSSHPIGTLGFFDDLDEYHFDKLRYLPKLVDYNGYQGKKILEIGCGIGTDLVRFAKGGAEVAAVDLSDTAIDLARKNFELRGLTGDFRVMNGETLEFQNSTFDMVFAHGVLQYTADTQKMIGEAHRVLKPGGEFIGQLYNRKGWLIYMSKLFKVDLEHDDAPAFKLFTIKDFKQLLTKFREVEITPERFPVKSRLHKGAKGFLYNTFFVGGFNLIPRPLVRKTGWHLMCRAIK